MKMIPPGLSRDEISLIRAKRLAFRIWAVIGIGIITLGVLRLLGILSDFIVFVCVGCIIAFAATPLANKLERHHVPRGVGSLLGVVMVVTIIALIFVVLLPIVSTQVMTLLADLGRQIPEMGRWLSSMESKYDVFAQISSYVQLDAIISELQKFLSGLATSLFNVIGDGLFPLINRIASMVFVVFLGLVFAFWMVYDYPRINGEICHILGEGKEDDFRLVLAVVAQSVGGYLKSMLINSLIQGFLAFLWFWAVGHPYAGVMGFLSGLLNFLPVVGPSISAIVATGIALLYDPLMALWTLLGAVVSQNVTDNVIAPKINQGTMKIHPVLSLSALVIGSTLMGSMGMIIAIPLCAVIKSLFIFYFESRTGKQIVNYDGALFQGTPFHDEQGKPVPAYDALGDDSFVLVSELVDADEMPDATAAPKPELDNPWAKLVGLQPGSTGMFRNPFATDEGESEHDERPDGEGGASEDHHDSRPN